ncbi:MAG: hypothetical protein JXA22_03155 [Candidatus Thermoplasmatota archaeon]|nr:hypothetical protein [Candidatus Thermoplasmatota archaeon]
MHPEKKPVRKRRWTSVFFTASIVLLSIILIGTTPFVKASGEHPEREIETECEFSFDVKGYLSEFTIWLTFPKPLDTSFAEMHIEVVHIGDSWLLSNSRFPYSHVWTNDNRTLEIGSRGVDLTGKDIGKITLHITTPLMLGNGSLYWEDYNDLDLIFGGEDLNIDIDFGYIITFAGFCLPSLILIIAIVIIEVSLRAYMKTKKIKKKVSTTETLLQLIERSESWTRRRMAYLLVISSLLLTMLAFSFLLATINLLFAMILVMLGVLLLFPWVVLIITSIMYFMMRKEDLYWKKKLKYIKKQQIEFMKALEKE